MTIFYTPTCIEAGHTMALKYLAKNSRLYQSDTISKIHTIMIYGDEVDTMGTEQNSRIRVRFRGERLAG